MNILFLLRLWPVYGGGETVTLCLANEMSKRGWNVGILYFKDNLRKELPYIHPNINATKIENIDCDEYHQNHHDAAKVIQATKEYICKYSTNVIINQWWDVEYIKGLKGYKNVKIIKCLHTSFYSPRFDKTDIKTILKKAFKPIYIYRYKHFCIKQVTDFLPYVDKYVFLSESFQQQYQEMSHDDNKNRKLISIPNPATYLKTIPETDLKNKENIVLVVARMEERVKCLSKVLKTWKLIEEQEDLQSWKLIMVGEGRDLAYYKQLSSDLALKNIFFEGFKNPESYYKKAKIFLMTSAVEGFGMTLVEAQQFGVTPIVMNTFLALHDVIRHNYNGFITPPNDIPQFAKYTMELMRNEELRNKLSYNCLKFSQQFLVNKIVDKWASLIQNL